MTLSLNSKLIKSTTVPLSAIEKSILQFIKQGLTSAEIAKKRNCSIRTIEKHRSNIIKKLGLKSSQNALLVWTLNNVDLVDT